MNENILSGASLLPFQVSKSKRSVEYRLKRYLGYQDQSYQRSRPYHQMLRTLLPDPHFDWIGFINPEEMKIENKSSVKTEALTGNNRTYRIVPISLHLIKALGIQVLAEGRLCFGGEPLKGIFLPSEKPLQIELIKRFIIWYSPCFEDDQNTLKLNKICLHDRQTRFLKMYLHSWGYHNKKN